MEPEDGTLILIIRRLRNHLSSNSISTVTPYIGTSSSKVTVLHTIIIPPRSQYCVTVRCNKNGLVELQTCDRLWDRNQCVSSAVIIECKSTEPFQIFMANFGDIPKRLARQKNRSLCPLNLTWIRRNQPKYKCHYRSYNVGTLKYYQHRIHTGYI